ncbi:MAG: ATP-binding protein [bacterium]|nr:ATP-binding protein [Candidatus Margulisiibacteriota bacterium]
MNEYIKRIAEENLAKTLTQPKVAIILGARQVGKTTLTKHVLANRNVSFLNLDIEPNKQSLLAAAPLPPLDAIKSLGNPEILVIDEAQRLPETGRIVKGWFDANIPTKIILLGSSSLNLINQAAESLTGRNEKLFLPPLLFKEIIVSQSWHSPVFTNKQIEEKFPEQIQTLLMQSLAFGHYPETISLVDKQTHLLNLAADYLLKDILQIGLIKTPELLKNLLMLLAHQIGSEVSISELATSLGIARVTVERYLELLVQTFVIFKLPAFSTNPRKEINKSQKIYFWDTGIRNALLNDFSTNPMRSDIGKLWENWVIAEFAKKNLLNGGRQNLYFWRSRSSGEVDLVVKEGEVLSAYEIKWKARSSRQRAFVQKYNTKVEIIDHSRPLSWLDKKD